MTKPWGTVSEPGGHGNSSEPGSPQQPHHWSKPVVVAAGISLVVGYIGLSDCRAPWAHPKNTVPTLVSQANASNTNTSTPTTNAAIAPAVASPAPPSLPASPEPSPDIQPTETSAESALPAEAVAFQGHHYLLVRAGVSTWPDAMDYCASFGGYMAHISSAQENVFLFQYISDQGVRSAYFGLSDRQGEGLWKWSDGVRSAYTNWHPGEPNSENPHEDYAMFYWKFGDGSWNDGDFEGSGTVGDTSAFLCEWST